MKPIGGGRTARSPDVSLAVRCGIRPIRLLREPLCPCAETAAAFGGCSVSVIVLSSVRPSRTSVRSSLRRGLVSICSTICSVCAAFAQDAHSLPNNYKELVYKQVQFSFVNPSSVGLIEISSAHRSRAPQVGDWMVCLRIELNGQPAPYAAFIDSEPPQVSLFRRAVLIDECGRDQYEPLGVARPPVEKSSPAPRRK